MGTPPFWRPSGRHALFQTARSRPEPTASGPIGRHAVQSALLSLPWRHDLFASTYSDHCPMHAPGSGALIMLRIAQRYLAAEIYRSSAIVLLALMGLFTCFNLIDELDRISATFSVTNLLYLEALNLPTQLYELLPIGLLIGSI